MVAAAVAAAGVAGAAMSSSSSRSAARTQANAANRSADLQYEAQQQMREDLAPWTSSGAAAQSRLNQLLGIGGGGAGAGRAYSEQELRDMLTAQFTTTTPGATNKSGVIPVTVTPDDPRWDWTQPWSQDGPEGGQRTQVVWQPVSSVGPSTTTVNTEALNAEVQRRLEEQRQAQQAYESDPAFGSLLRAYRDGEEFDPGPAFSFTGQDLASEPGYQFGLNQGTQGIERGQASRGNFLSGAAMKELARFNEDYAGTKFNDAYNRSLGTYNTNLGARERAWNTNLGAYNNNQERIYNFLSGTSTRGQNSAAQVGNNNQNVASSAGNALMQGANAQAAGTIASSNAWQSGLNQAANAYNAYNNPNTAAGWNALLSNQGGGYSGYTGYVGQSDPIATLNATNGWTG